MRIRVKTIGSVRCEIWWRILVPNPPVDEFPRPVRKKRLSPGAWKETLRMDVVFSEANHPGGGDLTLDSVAALRSARPRG